uniref:Replicase large subunit n=1 Tax=Ullucus tobamovirus 1 TaxID=2491948 RepID=A0A3G8FWP5_9VIRU|nr:orf2 [Ullucus tobamovirus 1]
MFVPTPKSGAPTDLQFYYDTLLPGNSTVMNEFDAVTMVLRDNVLNVKDCTIDFSKSVPLPRVSKEFLKPLIRTSAEKPRTPGLLENLVAMIKRNMNAPDLTGTIDIEDTAAVVADRFFESYIVKEFSGLEGPLLTNDAFQRWLSKQESSTIGQLANFNFVDLPAVDQYKHMIKCQPKQKLDLSIQDEYPALQTIVYHSKQINAIFGPLFSELTRLLLERVDSSKFLFYTRRTPTQIQEFFSDLDSTNPMDVLELDISKYDKSQNEFHCAVEYAIWERLGLNGFLEEVWKQGHRKTTIKDFIAGIKTCIWYQRKSGDVTTFIGNTVIIAACLASLVPMEKVIKAAFCGDDSLIYLPRGTDLPDIQSGANLMWNFEAKLFRKRYGYFCGRYIIHHDKGAIVYYDPLKLISKLGCKHITDWDHLEEFRVSLSDVCVSLTNCAYFGQLNDAIAEVHNTAVNGSFAFCCVVKYLSDKRLFRDLFFRDGLSDRETKGVGVSKPYKG